MIRAVQPQIYLNNSNLYTSKRMQNRNVSFEGKPVEVLKTIARSIINTNEGGSYVFAALWAGVGMVSKAYGTDCQLIHDVVNISNKIPPPFHVSESFIMNSPFILSGAEVVKGLGWRFFKNKTRIYLAKSSETVSNKF